MITETTTPKENIIWTFLSPIAVTRAYTNFETQDKAPGKMRRLIRLVDGEFSSSRVPVAAELSN